MGKMMQFMMGGRQTKDLYPTLMSLPNLSPEMRAKVEAQAQQRMEEGVALMSRAAAALTNATAARDYASMDSGASQLLEGVAEFDSRVATLQALNEGKPPQEIALRWFRTQMNLASVAGLTTPEHRILGLSLLHFFVMLALTAFFVAMVWMYFFQDATRSAVASTSCRGNVLHGGCSAYRFTRLSDHWSSSLRRAINTNGTGSSSASTFPEDCWRKYRE
jgi:hypothetical protein